MTKYGWHGDIGDRGFDPDIAAAEARFHPPKEHACDVTDCHNLARWDGWVKTSDPLGNPTGLNQRIQVCHEHKARLIGSRNPQALPER